MMTQEPKTKDTQVTTTTKEQSLAFGSTTTTNRTIKGIQLDDDDATRKETIHNNYNRRIK